MRADVIQVNSPRKATDSTALPTLPSGDHLDPSVIDAPSRIDSDTITHRLQQVLNQIIGEDNHNRYEWCKAIGCADSTMRLWLDGGPPRDRDKVLRILRIDLSKFYYSNEKAWKEYAVTLPHGLPPPKPPAAHASPIVRTQTLLTSLQSVEPRSTVITVLHQYDDTWFGDMKSCAIANAERNVGNLFVTHRKSGVEDFLRKLMASRRFPPGSVKILLLPSEDTLLLMVKCIILVTHPGTQVSQIAIEQTDEEDFVRGYMQAYTTGARLPPENRTVTPEQSPLWTHMAHNQIATASDMLKRWSPKGDWLQMAAGERGLSTGTPRTVP